MELCVNVGGGWDGGREGMNPNKMSRVIRIILPYFSISFLVVDALAPVIVLA